MKLGENGYASIMKLYDHYTAAESLCTEWQQEFFNDFCDKAEAFEEDTKVSEKQLKHLNAIAEIYGCGKIDAED